MTVTATSLILVAVLKEPRDLEIARLLGWYRIPLRSAPKVIAVDYLAFYQTAAFGDQGGRAQWIAPVHGHELLTRAELFQDEPNHPHAAHEYYKIQLGALERLPHPLLAHRWRRITFFYTLGELVMQAQTLDDLVIQASDERQRLWSTLRERGQADFGAIETEAPDLDPAVLAALLGLPKLEEK